MSAALRSSGQKSSPSYEVKDSDIRRAVAAIAHLPSSTLPDSPFIRALGTPAAQNVPPQTGTLAQRALEEWERTLCENKAVAILEQMQAGRPALIQKDGGEMLIAIVLDRPLADAKALVDDPTAFTQEMTRILLEKQNHPLKPTATAYTSECSTPPYKAKKLQQNKNVRMRENFRGKPRRLKLEQMHMNVYIF